MKSLHSIINRLRAVICFSLAMSAIVNGNAQTTFTNEFWISTNVISGGGSGTLSSPFDGSTALNFDRVMSNLPPYSAIHILAGRYETGGNTGWYAKSGQNIIGSGIDVTILHLTNNSPVSSWAVVTVSPATNVAVSDLTVDLSGSTNNGGAVVLEGASHAIRRVKAVNGTTTTNLSFLLVIDSKYNIGISDKNVVEECEVSSIKGGSCRGICLNGYTNSPISGSIRNNRVYLSNLETSGTSDQAAFGGGCMNNCLIEGNYVSGAGSAIDAASHTNIIITHNHFRNCDYGLDMGLGNSTMQNISFCHNVIELAHNSSNASTAVYFSATGTYTNISIIGNTIKFATSGGLTAYSVAANTATGLTVVNNSIESTMTSTFSGCTGLNVYNNTDLFGNALTGMNQVEPPNGITRRSVAANYTATYADRYIGVKASPCTITMPSAVAHLGKEFIIADESGVGSLTIAATSPDKINAAASIAFSGAYTNKVVISDGTNWFAR